MFKGIDLFSDTVTRPTQAMKLAMMEADVGDEQRGEDPTTLKLESTMAELLGQESALFFPSATMANEVALLALIERGEELMAAANAHLFVAEAGGPAFHAGAQAVPIGTPNGIFTGEDIERHYRAFHGPLHPISAAVAVENTTNMGGGIAWTDVQLRSVLETAKHLKLKTHLDGSRLFNACARTGLSPAQVASPFDTVTVCLSKGLGCPTGAVLAFAKSRYGKIRRLKQLMGGSLRQSGLLAAAGLYGLAHHRSRLEEDHQNAQRLAEGLRESAPQIEVEFHPLSTNMVFFKWAGVEASSLFQERCLRAGLRFSLVGVDRFRAVTHYDVDRTQIESALNIVRDVCRSFTQP